MWHVGQYNKQHHKLFVKINTPAFKYVSVLIKGSDRGKAGLHSDVLGGFNLYIFWHLGKPSNCKGQSSVNTVRIM